MCELKRKMKTTVRGTLDPILGTSSTASVEDGNVVLQGLCPGHLTGEEG